MAYVYYYIDFNNNLENMAKKENTIALPKTQKDIARLGPNSIKILVGTKNYQSHSFMNKLRIEN